MRGGQFVEATLLLDAHELFCVILPDVVAIA
jgi:hypothetical protein